MVTVNVSENAEKRTATRWTEESDGFETFTGKLYHFSATKIKKFAAADTCFFATPNNPEKTAGYCYTIDVVNRRVENFGGRGSEKRFTLTEKDELNLIHHVTQVWTDEKVPAYHGYNLVGYVTKFKYRIRKY